MDGVLDEADHALDGVCIREVVRLGERPGRELERVTHGGLNEALRAPR